MYSKLTLSTVKLVGIVHTVPKKTGLCSRAVLDCAEWCTSMYTELGHKATHNTDFELNPWLFPPLGEALHQNKNVVSCL